MVALALALSCTSSPPVVRSPPAGDDTGTPVAHTGTITTADTAGPCPAGMAAVDAVCMDRFEAPGMEGGAPFVMVTFDEADAWCVARGKRLCFDDEWQRACEGDAGSAYPYGDVHDPGVCNDDEVWRVYDQGQLNGWPGGLDVAAAADLDALYALATAAGGATAVAHVASLYQAEGSGQNTGCRGQWPVFDLVGNIEEWTRRRDGGSPSFHGNLKGRYWAESRTCQSQVTTHGDGFRFYEIGFRCCSDAL